MADKLIGKRYYKIDFELASALSIGGNASYATDKDIVYNGNGIPYIPATSLAGIYRSFFKTETANKYFGSKTDFTDSRIYVYDAELKSDKYNVSKRDCVSLDEWKTSIKGSKFDFEIIEPETKFVTYIEQNIYENINSENIEIDDNVGDVVADMWAKEKIQIGGKTSRGLGRVKNVSVKLKDFSFKSEEDKNKWFDFDIFDEKYWEDAVIWNSEKEKHWSENIHTGKITLNLKMKQVSPIIIRTYTTNKEDSDYKPLTFTKYNTDGKEIKMPVIPGTSWAGAFKAHIEKLGFCNVKEIFGYSENKKSKASSIYFSESIIEKSKSKILSRNSIDRFTGGTVENALFTEEICYGGETVLEISFNKNYEDGFYKAMAASIIDMHEGIISIGGETSVGRGLFRLIKIKCDGNKIEFN